MSERLASERRIEEVAERADVGKWRALSREEQRQRYDEYVLRLWNGGPTPRIDRR